MTLPDLTVLLGAFCSSGTASQPPYLTPQVALSTISRVTTTPLSLKGRECERPPLTTIQNAIIPIAPDYAPVDLVNGLPLLLNTTCFDFPYLTSYHLLHSLNVV